MPDFPRRDLVRLEVKTHCSEPGCSLESPCDACVFLGLGLAANVPLTEDNIKAAYRYIVKLREQGRLSKEEAADQTHRILHMYPEINPER